MSPYALNNFVNATTGPTVAVVIMALPNVRPIGKINAAIRPINLSDPFIPRVVCDHEIIAMSRNVSRARSLQDVVVDTTTVRVAQKDGIAVFVWPIVAQIDHRSTMGVPSSQQVCGPFRVVARSVGRVNKTQRRSTAPHELSMHDLRTMRRSDTPHQLSMLP